MNTQAILDHLILGINDLDRGVAWVEERTGVRAAWGGVHPGRGTRNALLALGPDCYLEIMAPDPAQSSLAWFTQLREMAEPRLITWAVHTSDLSALAQKARAAGFETDGPRDGARARPDGKNLSWKLLHLRDNRGGLLPFFIAWDRDSVHPAWEAPKGCNLVRFVLQSPAAEELKQACQTVGVEIRVEPSEALRMIAIVASPRGDVEFTS